MTLPHSCKKAVVCTLLKKRSVHLNVPASYRLISNLSFLCKVVEKAVDDRLSAHVHSNRLLPAFQSAYRPYHSLETAEVHILNDMIGVVDKGRISAFVLLNLSETFDTVNQLHLEYGDEGTVWSRQKCSRMGDRLP